MQEGLKNPESITMKEIPVSAKGERGHSCNFKLFSTPFIRLHLCDLPVNLGALLSSGVSTRMMLSALQTGTAIHKIIHILMSLIVVVLV